MLCALHQQLPQHVLKQAPAQRDACAALRVKPNLVCWQNTSYLQVIFCVLRSQTGTVSLSRLQLSQIECCHRQNASLTGRGSASRLQHHSTFGGKVAHASPCHISPQDFMKQCHKPSRTRLTREALLLAANILDDRGRLVECPGDKKCVLAMAGVEVLPVKGMSACAAGVQNRA